MSPSDLLICLIFGLYSMYTSYVIGEAIGIGREWENPAAYWE